MRRRSAWSSGSRSSVRSSVELGGAASEAVSSEEGPVWRRLQRVKTSRFAPGLCLLVACASSSSAGAPTVVEGEKPSCAAPLVPRVTQHCRGRVEDSQHGSWVDYTCGPPGDGPLYAACPPAVEMPGLSLARQPFRDLADAAPPWPRSRSGPSPGARRAQAPGSASRSCLRGAEIGRAHV